MRSLLLGFAVVSVVACNQNDPIYMECPDDPAAASINDPLCVKSVTAGEDDGMGNLSEIKTHLTIPIKIEKAKDAAERAMRSAELGVDVPYVKLGDIEIEVEYTITNLDAMEGEARVELDGANEYFTYDPDLIVLSNDDEAPPTPGLDGNIPIHVPGMGTVSGIFREDQLREASIDVDQVTRANVNPFRATLTINKNDQQIVPFLAFDPMMPDLPPMPDPNAVPIPREAFASIVRVDLVFQPDRPMTLTYNVRVRDVRGDMINDELYTAPAADVTQFAPVDFTAMAAPGT